MTPVDITVTGEDFVSINQEADIPVGTELQLQTKSNHPIVIQRSDLKPSPDNSNGRIMKGVGNKSSVYTISTGSEEVWLRLLSDNTLNRGVVTAGFFSETTPVEVEYAARLDGLSQYWQTSSPVTASTLSFTFIKDGVTGDPEDNAMGVLALNNSTTYLTLLPTGIIEVNSAISSLTFNEDVISDGDDITSYLDGRKLSVVVNFSSPTQFNILGRGRYVIQFLEGILYNINVDNGLLILPMDDPEQGDTQNPTTGTTTIRMLNYSGDVWEEV